MAQYVVPMKHFFVIELLQSEVVKIVIVEQNIIFYFLFQRIILMISPNSLCII